MGVFVGVIREQVIILFADPYAKAFCQKNASVVAREDIERSKLLIDNKNGPLPLRKVRCFQKVPQFA